MSRFDYKPLQSTLIAACLTLAGSAFAGDLSAKFKQAGVEKGSATYVKLLSSMNIAPFNHSAEEAREDLFKMCKRRWVSSPVGAFSGLVVEGTSVISRDTGDGPVEVNGTFKETLENVTKESFDLRFSIDSGEGEKEEGVLKVTRAEYIITCQQVYEEQRAMEKGLNVTFRYSDPYLVDVQTEGTTYKAIGLSHFMTGTFDNGSKFELRKFTADTNFGVYRKALAKSDVMIFATPEGQVEGIMAITSQVTKVSVKK